MANEVKKFLDYTGVTKLVELQSNLTNTLINTTAVHNVNGTEVYDINKKLGTGRLNIINGTDNVDVETSRDTDGNLTVKISSTYTDTKVTDVENHYVPVSGAEKLSENLATNTITSLTVDAAGHVTGATLSPIAFPVTSVSEGTSTENYVQLTVNSTNSDVKISINDEALADKIDITDNRLDDIDDRLDDIDDRLDGIDNRIDAIIAGGISFKGVVAELPSKPQNGDLIIIGGNNITASDVVYKKDYEYVYSNGSWYELGDSDKNAKEITNLDDRVTIIEEKVTELEKLQPMTDKEIEDAFTAAFNN